MSSLPLVTLVAALAASPALADEGSQPVFSEPELSATWHQEKTQQGLEFELSGTLAGRGDIAATFAQYRVDPAEAGGDKGRSQEFELALDWPLAEWGESVEVGVGGALSRESLRQDGSREEANGRALSLWSTWSPAPGNWEFGARFERQHDGDVYGNEQTLEAGVALSDRLSVGAELVRGAAGSYSRAFGLSWAVNAQTAVQIGAEREEGSTAFIAGVSIGF